MPKAQRPAPRPASPFVRNAPTTPSQADVRLTFGAGLFRVGLLICILTGYFAITHQSTIMRAFASGGAAASVVGVILMLIARRQGGRLRTRRR